MRKTRMCLVGVVSLVLLTGAVVPAAGHEARVTEDVLFEVVLPASALPDPFRNLYFEAETLAPGLDGVISARVENMRGRTIYVDAGELVIEPMADALLWRQEAAIGGEPEAVRAGESVALTAGELILLPAIPWGEFDPEAVIPIANPGSEPTVTYGFHLCSGGGAPRWPEGMVPIVPAGGVVTSAGPLAPLASGEAVVRLTRKTLEPGATTGFDEQALFSLHRLESGSIDASYTSAYDDKVVTYAWEPGRSLPTHATKTDWELRASSEVPASMVTLEGTAPPSSSE